MPVVLEKPGIEPATPDLQGIGMPCKSGIAGSIPGFSRTTFGSAFTCSHHKIHTQIINPPALVLVTTQGKPQKLFYYFKSNSTVKPVLSSHLKIDKIKILMGNGS